jgi:hypothetical protein
MLTLEAQKTAIFSIHKFYWEHISIFIQKETKGIHLFINQEILTI